MGGLVIGPATQQSAKAKAFTALKSIGTGGDTTADGSNLILGRAVVNIPDKPFGAGSYEAIPPAYRQQLPRRFTAERM
jgi:hypothetical protein